MLDGIEGIEIYLFCFYRYSMTLFLTCCFCIFFFDLELLRLNILARSRSLLHNFLLLESVCLWFENKVVFRNFYNFNIFICRRNNYFFIGVALFNMVSSRARNLLDFLLDFFLSYIRSVKWGKWFLYLIIIMWNITTWANCFWDTCFLCTDFLFCLKYECHLIEKLSSILL